MNLSKKIDQVLESIETGKPLKERVLGGETIHDLLTTTLPEVFGKNGYIDEINNFAETCAETMDDAAKTLGDIERDAKWCVTQLEKVLGANRELEGVQPVIDQLIEIQTSAKVEHDNVTKQSAKLDAKTFDFDDQAMKAMAAQAKDLGLRLQRGDDETACAEAGEFLF